MNKRDLLSSRLEHYLELHYPRDNSPMSREFNVIIERDSDGYFVASVLSMAGCHTQAKSLDGLMKRIKEAIELCLEIEQA